MKKLALLPLLLVVACNSGGSDSESTENAEGAEAAPAAMAAGPTWNAVAGVNETVQGTTANEREASTINADGCWGYIPNNAHATIHVAEAGQYNVAAVAGDMSDLTLAIQGPDGSFFCDDDGGSEILQPMVDAMFAPGDYNVFVGTFSEDTNAAFTLTLTPGAVADAPAGGGGAAALVTTGTAPTTTANGTYGGLTIPAETAAHTFNGNAGGPNSANALNPMCFGQIAAAPDHVLEVQAAQHLNLAVLSQGDLTLTVQGPNGVFYCNDDDNGLNPGIHETFAPGTYNVYVGVLFGTDTPAYTMSVSR